ncbi:PAP/fibrillin family protein [Halotia branconii]|uniref:PAP/fibrillin family protein n=1 Tax=Halotia branconii CENA392 TaxID=1539056 RepID=A0AAJ6NNV5_9CYAN|nr:PAP/fibrillin family protein [Halotia branconii]WGV23983.1 PAP/fibrillin family protein [Halotia branconii CENA392]
MSCKLANLKQELISISEASEMGFNYTSIAQQQIETLAQKLESLNPTNEPTNHLAMIQGRWRLLYSTFGLERETTLQRLSFGKLPDVNIRVTGIFQEVYILNQQYNNLIECTVGSSIGGIVLVKGRYTIEDIKRLNIDFLKTSVNSTNNELSDSAFREVLQVNKELPLEASLSFNGWVDITFLDETLRLVRGNQNNLYILLRNE